MAIYGAGQGPAVILFTTVSDDETEVRFAFDETALAIIKSVPVHRWHPDDKYWATETSWVQLLAKRFVDKGFDVCIDGELWSPPDPKAIGSPLQALLEALPAHLRRPVYLALAKALHPDQGGSNEWMGDLNAAMERDRR
jgi:hypothetical protein